MVANSTSQHHQANFPASLTEKESYVWSIRVTKCLFSLLLEHRWGTFPGNDLQSSIEAEIFLWWRWEQLSWIAEVSRLFFGSTEEISSWWPARLLHAQKERCETTDGDSKGRSYMRILGRVGQGDRKMDSISQFQRLKALLSRQVALLHVPRREEPPPIPQQLPRRRRLPQDEQLRPIAIIQRSAVGEAAQGPEAARVIPQERQVKCSLDYIWYDSDWFWRKGMQDHKRKQHSNSMQQHQAHSAA